MSSNFKDGPTPTTDKLACAHAFTVRTKLREMERRCRAAETLLAEASAYLPETVIWTLIQEHLKTAKEMDNG